MTHHWSRTVPLLLAMLAGLLGPGVAAEEHAASAADHGAPAKGAHGGKDAGGKEAAGKETREMPAGQFSVLQRLMAGNTRFVAGKTEHPRQDASARAANAQGQKPVAIILGCSDSRVPPETLFDQGVGDLFIIRVAGNVVSNENLASMEYAVEHLHVGVIVVLGHERCGAVKATVAGGEVPGHLPALINRIKPAVDGTKGLPGDPVDNAVCLNARLQAKAIAESAPILAKAVEEGEVAVLAARYDLDTGAVEVLW